MSVYTTQTSDKSQKTALKLCFFGGFLGLHLFYVGKYFKGLIFLMTFGFFMFGWGLDIIKILMGNFRDNVGQPLRK